MQPQSNGDCVLTRRKMDDYVSSSPDCDNLFAAGGHAAREIADFVENNVGNGDVLQAHDDFSPQHLADAVIAGACGSGVRLQSELLLLHSLPNLHGAVVLHLGRAQGRLRDFWTKCFPARIRHPKDGRYDSEISWSVARISHIPHATRHRHAVFSV